MDRLIQVLRGISEVDVPRARSLAGNETWNGPRAEAVREDLQRLHVIVSDALELALHHRSSRQYSIDTDDSHGQWDF
jgi:hypothetical protein